MEPLGRLAYASAFQVYKTTNYTFKPYIFVFRQQLQINKLKKFYKVCDMSPRRSQPQAMQHVFPSHKVPSFHKSRWLLACSKQDKHSFITFLGWRSRIRVLLKCRYYISSRHYDHSTFSTFDPSQYRRHRAATVNSVTKKHNNSWLDPESNSVNHDCDR